MSTRTEHSRLLLESGTFKINCSTSIFNNEEIEIIKKYGHWFMALTTSELTPLTDLQNRFVAVTKNEIEPFSIEEKAWHKYLGRTRLEREHGASFNLHYEPEEDTFYNRGMAKKLHKIMFSEMSKNHKR